MKLLRVGAGLLLAFVALALCFDALVGALQPSFQPEGAEGILHTFDADGTRHDSRLAVVDDAEGNVWIQSGHYFRGWYHRLLENPEVELTRSGETRAYTAVPIDTPESEALIVQLFKQRAGGPARFYLIRTLLLFADIKPVRLDPRGAQ